jgi:hypothetical protein
LLPKHSTAYELRFQGSKVVYTGKDNKPLYVKILTISIILANIQLSVTFFFIDSKMGMAKGVNNTA